MSDGANKKPSAKELAASLANKNPVEVLEVIKDMAQDNTNVDVVELVGDEVKAYEETLFPAPTGPVLVKMYEVVADYVTGVSTRVEDQNIAVLKGRVTDADLDVAQVDKAWLLKSGAIVEAGFDYV